MLWLIYTYLWYLVLACARIVHARHIPRCGSGPTVVIDPLETLPGDLLLLGVTSLARLGTVKQEVYVACDRVVYCTLVVGVIADCETL